MEAYAPEVPNGFPMISVVGDGFCAPYPIELIVKKRYLGFFNARYEVLDVDGYLFLKVDGSNRSPQKKRVMTDPSGSTILTMRGKVTNGFTWRNFTKGNESFPVKINAGVDCAFIVVLFVVVTENDDYF